MDIWYVYLSIRLSPIKLSVPTRKTAVWHLASLDTITQRLDRIETPYTSITNLQAIPGGVLFNASSSMESSSIVHLNLATKQFEIVCRSSEIEIDAGYFSTPQAIEFPTEGWFECSRLLLFPAKL